MKVLALDHKNNIARPSINAWQTNVRKWYSSTSNRTQIAVAPPRTPADIFLSLHRNTSAAAPQIKTVHLISQREKKKEFLLQFKTVHFINSCFYLNFPNWGAFSSIEALLKLLEMVLPVNPLLLFKFGKKCVTPANIAKQKTNFSRTNPINTANNYKTTTTFNS